MNPARIAWVTENPRNAMVCDTPYLQNEFGDPQFFFTFLNLFYHSLPKVKVLKKICTRELLGANVLKCKTKLNWITTLFM